MTRSLRGLACAAASLALAGFSGLALAQAPTQPASKPTTPPAVSAAEAPKPTDDILETAAKAGNFKTLISALETAGLTQTLKGKGPFTVFAPTDEAFAKLPKEQLDALLRPENKNSLVSTLRSHVLLGQAMKAERIIKAKAFHAKMANGSYVAFDAKDGGPVKFGGTNVVKTDIAASNGVIHVIDQVYLPKRVRTVLFAKETTDKAKAAAGPAATKAKDAVTKAYDATKDAAGKALDKAKSVVTPTPAPAPSPAPAPANK